MAKKGDVSPFLRWEGEFAQKHEIAIDTGDRIMISEPAMAPLNTEFGDIIISKPYIEKKESYYVVTHDQKLSALFQCGRLMTIPAEVSRFIKNPIQFYDIMRLKLFSYGIELDPRDPEHKSLLALITSRDITPNPYVNYLAYAPDNGRVWYSYIQTNGTIYPLSPIENANTTWDEQIEEQRKTLWLVI